jgi:hypothetical protein
MPRFAGGDSKLGKLLAYVLIPEGGGGGADGPWCMRCKGPITAEQHSVRLRFEHDPHGHRGLTGLYHDYCSKPFESLARVINMLSFRPF